MIYRWKYDNEKTGPELAQYGRDGCTRWYPGKNFVRTWDVLCDPDPGMESFIDKHKATFLEDSEAK
eukprot:14926842-Heterocapsa_arctica.AAC.1